MSLQRKGKRLLLMGLAVWLGVGGGYAQADDEAKLLRAQAALLESYRQNLDRIEKGPLQLFNLLVTFANHELATADLVKSRIYADGYPDAIKDDIEDYQLRQSQALNKAVNELNPEALARFKDRQQRELVQFRDRRLMEFTRAEIQARDRTANQYLQRIFGLIEPDPGARKRIERKQRKLDTALRSLAKAYQRFDISDHRLSTRVDRIKEFRMERISMLMVLLAQPADQALADSVALATELDRSHRQLDQDMRRHAQPH